MTVAVGNNWEVRRIVRRMLPLLFVLSLMEIMGGLFLEQFKALMVENPALLIILPVMIGMGGNLGSIIAARFSTALHLGTMDESFFDDQVVSNGLATCGLALTLSIFVALVAYGIGNLLGGGVMSFLSLFLVTVASGLTLAILVVLVATSVTIFSYKHGVDPDDTAIPIVTNICDIMGVLILIGYVLLLV